VLLLAAPVLEGLTLGPPWFSFAEARYPALAAGRVVLVLLVGVAYVRTTPVRETRAAIERLVPGRVGRFLGLGTGLVLRFLPLLLADLRRSREAARARLVERRPLQARMRIVAAGGLRRAFSRADTLSLALRARCLAWNPTPPPLRFGRLDVGAWLVVVGLLAFALV
jgi:biotin transport system permease protein